MSAILEIGGSSDSPRVATEPGTESPRTPVGIEALTKAQRNRFHFFQQQRVFISNLTEIAERLRFQERDVRKYFLRRDMGTLVIPPFSYIPLCTSLSPFRCVLRALPQEGHAFNTKARCPALMLFEVEEHPNSADVASFLGAELQEYDSDHIKEDELQTFEDYSKDGASRPLATHRSDDIMPDSHSATKESKFSRLHLQQQGYWSEEGTGLKRLATLGLTNSNPIAKMVLEGGRKHLPQVDNVSSSDTSNSNLDVAQNGDSNSLSFGVSGKISTGTGNSTGAGTNTSSSSDASPATGDESLDVRSSITSASAALSGIPTPKAAGQTMAPLMNNETFETLAERLRLQSPYGGLDNFKIVGLISKSNDDVRQEVFVMQLITYYQMAFKQERVPVWLHTYKILSTSKTTGIIQLIPNANSIDGLKKEPKFPGNLRAYFELTYGKGPALTAAISEYVKSIAGYSIISYLLAIKDR